MFSVRPSLLALALGATALVTPTAAHAASITFIFDNAGIVANALTTNTTPLTGSLTVTMTDVVDTSSGPGFPALETTQNILFTLVNVTNADLTRIRFNYLGGLSGARQLLAGAGPQPSILNFGSDIPGDGGVFDLSYGFGFGALGPNAALVSTFTLDVKGALTALSFQNPSLALLVSFDAPGLPNTNRGNALVAGRIVPEPVTLTLLGIGVAGAFVRRRSTR